MTLVLDTHAWIWWATEDKRLSRLARRTIESSRRLLVPTICLREVAMLVAHGRIQFSSEVGEWLRDATALPGVELTPISPEIAATSTSLGDEFHRDPADQIIVATALNYRVHVVTKDERIQGYAGVRTVW